MCSLGFCKRCSNIRRVIMLICNIKSKNYMNNVPLPYAAYLTSEFPYLRTLQLLVWHHGRKQKFQEKLVNYYTELLCGIKNGQRVYKYLKTIMCMYFFLKNKNSPKTCQNNDTNNIRKNLQLRFLCITISSMLEDRYQCSSETQNRT